MASIRPPAGAPSAPGASTALLLAITAACAASCSPGQPRPGFDARDLSPGRATAGPEAVSAARPRVQHTFGKVGESLFPAPAPDGTTLFFSSSRQGPHFSIVRKALGAAPVVTVTSGPSSDLHPAVSPDGRRLAFSSDREGGWAIHLLELAGGEPRRLTAPGVDAFGPSWSPDSRRLAYFRSAPAAGGRGGGFELAILDVESGEDQTIGPGLFPAWSPAGANGEWIAYQLSRERDGAWYSIWKVRPDGSRPTELVQTGAWGAVHPSWSPDGRWIAFAAVGKSPEARPSRQEAASRKAAARARADDIYLIGADGGRLTCLTGDRPGVAEWNPAFGPEGRLYFNSDEGGEVNIWSVAPPGTE